MTKDVTVTLFSVKELKVLDAEAYDKAIAGIIEMEGRYGDYCQWLTSDMNEWFNDGPGKLEEGESPFDDGEIEGWNYDDYRSLSYTFSVGAVAYMRRKKLCGKLRTLYNYLMDGWDTSLGGKAGTYENRRGDLAPLPYTVAEELERFIDYEWQDKERHARLLKQMGLLLDVLASDVTDVTEYLRKWMVGDVEYRYSEEFAVEEAEAHEWWFLPSGIMSCVG